MTKTKLLNYLSLWIMLLVFFPLLGNNLPKYASSIQLAMLLWFMSLIFLDFRILLNKYFIVVFSIAIFFKFIGYNTIWYYASSWTKSTSGKDFYAMILAISLLLYFNKNKKNRYKFGKITYWSFYAIIITSLVTIIVSITHPSIIRASYSTGEGIEIFNKFGVGSYGFATLLVMMIPTVMYFKKIRYFSAIFSYGVIALFILTTIRMQIFANILMSVIVLIFSFAGRNRLKKSYFILFVIAIILFIIPQIYYADFLTNVAQYFDSSSNVYFKLNDMAGYIKYGEIGDGSATATRVGRYPLLLSALSENPILGGFFVRKSYWDHGAHLYWMYKLGSFGILGFLLYFTIHYLYIKKSMKIFDETYQFYFLLSCFGFIGMGLMKNLTGRDMWLGYFLLLHGFYYMPRSVIIKRRN